MLLGRIVVTKFEIMRSKTFVLGFVALLMLVPPLLGSRAVSDQPEFGLSAGETVPSIKVEGVDWFRHDNADEDSAVLVVWSKEDAVSRIVNAWLSHSDHSAHVYSICIDADQTDAELYARADNVNPDTRILGAWNSEELRQELRTLIKSAPSTVFFTDNGVIHAVKAAADIWHEIQTNNLSSKI